MPNSELITIGEFVAHDYRTATVFAKHQIDFCCQGYRTIAEVCETKGISPVALLNELTAILMSENERSIDFKSWPVDLLVDYIEKKHHRYVMRNRPIIEQYLNRICQTHGGDHPELMEIKQLFSDGMNELTEHMKKEETELFPLIRKIESSANGDQSMSSLAALINALVKNIRVEHEHEGERFRKIAELSNHYTPPPYACNTFKVTFSMLKDFEQDLREHLHLENNILLHKVEQFNMIVADNLNQ